MTHDTTASPRAPALKAVRARIVPQLAQYGIYLALLILVVVFTASSDVFLTGANLLNVLRQVSIIGICAVGLTFVLLTGGIDLSVGSVIGVAGMTCATLNAMGVPVALAVAAALAFGLLAGLLAGFIINEAGIPPSSPRWA
jgi:ribose transport system permease protein